MEAPPFEMPAEVPAEVPAEAPFEGSVEEYVEAPVEGPVPALLQPVSRTAGKQENNSPAASRTAVTQDKNVLLFWLKQIFFIAQLLYDEKVQDSPPETRGVFGGSQ